MDRVHYKCEISFAAREDILFGELQFSLNHFLNPFQLSLERLSRTLGLNLPRLQLLSVDLIRVMQILSLGRDLLSFRLSLLKFSGQGQLVGFQLRRRCLGPSQFVSSRSRHGSIGLSHPGGIGPSLCLHFMECHIVRNIRVLILLLQLDNLSH